MREELQQATKKEENLQEDLIEIRELLQMHKGDS